LDDAVLALGEFVVERGDVFLGDGLVGVGLLGERLNALLKVGDFRFEFRGAVFSHGLERLGVGGVGLGLAQLQHGVAQLLPHLGGGVGLVRCRMQRQHSEKEGDESEMAFHDKWWGWSVRTGR